MPLYINTLERPTATISDIVDFINQHESEHEAKLQELQEWIDLTKTDEKKAMDMTELVAPRSILPTEWSDIVDDVMEKGVKYARNGKIDGTPNNWSCGDMGSRWLDYTCPLKYGEGKAKVRISFASRKFNQIHPDLLKNIYYALVFQITYDIPCCCLCPKPLIGWGNNPYPLKSEDDPVGCCNECNTTKVIPARMMACKTNKQRAEYLEKEFKPELEKLRSGDEMARKVFEKAGELYDELFTLATKPKRVIKKVSEEDIQREILKARKEAERKAKEEEEEKARKEAREQRKREQVKVIITTSTADVSVVVRHGKEDDEAKEIRRRAREVRVKVKTKNGGK